MADEVTVGTVIELENGVKCDMSDGAVAWLTVDGRDCSRCLTYYCRHITAAEPYYVRRKWVLAEKRRESWAPGMYAKIGIPPWIFFRPGEIDYFPLLPEHWAWPESGRMAWEVQGGYLVTFRDGGHVWISEGHPEGGTKCLLCGTRECRHWVEAKEEIEQWVAEYGALAGTRRSSAGYAAAAAASMQR